jgi:hypothetical protein
VYTERGVATTDAENAFRAFDVLAKRMSALLGDLPESLLRRLGMDCPAAAPHSDWVWVLFRLGWHFPEVFARGAVRRYRLLVSEHGDFCAPEDWLQLYDCTLTQDRFPGLVYSQFPRQVDLVTATAWAIDLLRCALNGGGKSELTTAQRNQFGALHHAFSTVGEHVISLASVGPFSEFEAKVLRLDSSFQTRPAAEWAGVRAGGAKQEVYFVSRNDAVKECCILRGPWVEQFTDLADRAGALLPEWPAEPAGGIVNSCG